LIDARNAGEKRGREAHVLRLKRNVMPGLEPGVHARPLGPFGVDRRDKPGHDVGF
jgi:hypothetical protein